MSRFINKTDAKRLLKKLEFKYGAELSMIQEECNQDIALYGHVRLETEAKRQRLIEKIKQEEQSYH